MFKAFNIVKNNPTIIEIERRTVSYVTFHFVPAVPIAPDAFHHNDRAFVTLRQQRLIAVAVINIYASQFHMLNLFSKTRLPAS